MTITSGTGAAAQIVLSPFGTGADGSVTISATKNINTDTISGGRTYADGINYTISSIYVSSVQCSATPNGIVAGDEIILMNMQGCTTDYGNVGNYEFMRVKEVSGSNLVFNSDVLKIYGSTYTQTNSNLLNQKIIVQRVPNWGNVTINSPGILTCAAWDGTKGGMVVFRSTGTVSVGSGASVDVSGKGYRGGNGGAGAPDSTDRGGRGGQGGETIYGYMSWASNGTTTLGGTGHLIADGVRGGRNGAGAYADGWGAGGGRAAPSENSGGGGAGGNSDIQRTDFASEKICLGPGAGGGGGGGCGNKSFSASQGGTAGGGGGGAGGGIVKFFANGISLTGNIKSDVGKGAGGGGSSPLYPAAPSQGAGGAGGTVGSGGVGTGGNGGNGNTGTGTGGAAAPDPTSGWGGRGGNTNVSGGGNGTSGDTGDADATGGGGAGASGGGGAGGGFDTASGGGGGRGGGGGSVYLIAASMNLGTNQVLVSSGIGGGGAGGSNGGTSNAGDGGDEGSPSGKDAVTYGTGGAQGARGASGKIRFDYQSLSGTTNPAYYAGTFPSGLPLHSATYHSNVLDTGVTGSKFIQVFWNPSSQPAGTNLAVGIRVSSYSFSIGSSTPSWTPATNGGNPGLTGRYIQWMSTFTTTISSVTPRLEDLAIVYKSSPVAPGIGLISGDTYNKITWRWTYPSSEPQPTNFKIYTSTDGLIATLEADTTYYTESGLKRNKEYFRYIQAYNAISSSNSATVIWRTKPGAFQSRTSQGNPTRTGPNAFGFVGDATWEWDVPVKAGSALTITAYIRYNSDYGAASKPKLTLSGRGITPTSISATVAAQDAWELLTLNPGTPSQNATLTLKAEGFSNTPGAKFYIDDVNISQ